MYKTIPSKAAYHIELSPKQKLAEESITHLIKEISDWLSDLQDIELNAETVHYLRVVIRQLKSVMYFFKPLIRKEVYLEGQMLLSESLHIFEQTRENTVLLEALEEFERKIQRDDSKSVESSIAPLARWKALFNDFPSTEVYSTETLKSGEVWRKHLGTWIERMGQKPFKTKKSMIQTKRFANRRMKRLMLQWLSRYQTLSVLDDEAVHKSRIECKRLRYMLRAMDGTLFKKSPALLKSLAEYQDQAGALHDISRFEEMMSQPALPEMEIVRQAFLSYEKERRAAIRETIPAIKNKLEKEIMRWVEDHKGEK